MLPRSLHCAARRAPNRREEKSGRSGRDDRKRKAKTKSLNTESTEGRRDGRGKSRTDGFWA